MGSNFKAVGFDSVEHMVAAMMESECRHLAAFCRANRLTDCLASDPPDSGSQRTLRWREMDSNFRFRASGDTPHRPRGEAASHRSAAIEGELLGV